jgi:hypothetical protein
MILFRSLDTNTYINGPQVHQFQKNAWRVYVKHVIPANGTDALQIAMMGLETGRWGYHWFYFAATVEVIALLQLTSIGRCWYCIIWIFLSKVLDVQSPKNKSDCSCSSVWACCQYSYYGCCQRTWFICHRG